MGAVLSAAFSRDSQRIVTFGEDNRAIIWAWRNIQQPLRAFPDIGGPAVVFSEDGERIITAKGARVASWEIGSQTAPSSIDLPPGEEAIAMSPLGHRVVTRAKNRDLKLFDTRTGLRVGSFLIKRAADVAFSSNGKYIVVSFWQDWNVVDSIGVRVWDAASGEPKRSSSDKGTGYISALGDADTPGSIAVNSDGSRVFVYNAGTSEMWTSQFDDWDPYYADAGNHKGAVTMSVFSPDDEYFATASDDKTVKIWVEQKDQKRNRTFLKPIHTLRGHTGEITSIKFSRDSKFVVTTSIDGSAKIWEVETGNLYASCDGHKGRVNAADLSSDGERLVTVADDGLIRVWDSKTGDLLAVIEAHTGAATSVAYNSDRSIVATTGVDGTCQILDLTFSSREAKQLSEHVERVTSVQISHDGLIPVTVRRIRQSPPITRRDK
jgi:WD40 repeat protein